MPLGSSNNAYAFAKAESTPGETFTVESIEPYFSTADLSKTNQALSLAIYQEAMAYQTQLSSVSHENYHIAKIQFYSNAPVYSPGPLVFAARVGGEANGNAGSAAVSQEVRMSAEVTFATEGGSVSANAS